MSSLPQSPKSSPSGFQAADGGLDVAARRAARRIITFLLALNALLATVGFRLADLRAPSVPEDEILLRDPAVREAIVSRLIADSSQLFDVHVDGDVGHVLQAKLKDRPSLGVSVSSNRLGLRERAFAMPKPPGLTRIVLLGSGLIHGVGVESDERLGASLERLILEGSAPGSSSVECVHVGVPDWNLRAASAFLRRVLAELEPDLVLHLAVPGDLGDSPGVRGFGSLAEFSSQQRRRADASITVTNPFGGSGVARAGLLAWGLDAESRSRYRSALQDVVELSRVLAERGADYRLLLHFGDLQPVVHQHLGSHLPPEQVLYLPRDWAQDPGFRDHGTGAWSEEAHRAAARLLFDVIAREGLLPGLVGEVVAGVARDSPWRTGRVEAEGETRLDLASIRQEIKVSRSAEVVSPQIHGGIDSRSRVSPYASLILARSGGGRLVVEGRALPRRELDGAKVRVYVEAEPVGEMELLAGERLRFEAPLPDAAAGQEYVNVRFEAADYVYATDEPRRCVVFELERVAIRP